MPYKAIVLQETHLTASRVFFFIHGSLRSLNPRKACKSLVLCCKMQYEVDRQSFKWTTNGVDVQWTVTSKA